MKMILAVKVNSLYFFLAFSHINIGEYRRGHWKWTIQRNWQHRVHKTMTSKTKT